MKDLADLRVTARDGGSRLEVFAKPRASRSEIGGVRDGALIVAVAAPPVDGAANDEIVRTLAAALGVKRSDVSIATGASSSTKIVDVASLAPDEVKRRLAGGRVE